MYSHAALLIVLLHTSNCTAYIANNYCFNPQIKPQIITFIPKTTITDLMVGSISFVLVTRFLYCNVSFEYLVSYQFF